MATATLTTQLCDQRCTLDRFIVCIQISSETNISTEGWNEHLRAVIAPGYIHACALINLPREGRIVAASTAAPDVSDARNRQKLTFFVYDSIQLSILYMWLMGLLDVAFACQYPSSICPICSWTNRLRNDLLCVGWGVKLYSLTHCSWTMVLQLHV